MSEYNGNPTFSSDRPSRRAVLAAASAAGGMAFAGAAPAPAAITTPDFSGLPALWEWDAPERGAGASHPEH
jgi:hypothetical protein